MVSLADQLNAALAQPCRAPARLSPQMPPDAGSPVYPWPEARADGRLSRPAAPASAGSRGPVEGRAGVGLAARRDVAVADDVGRSGIAPLQRAQRAREPRVLRGRVREVVGALELDADREVVAALAAPPRRHARRARRGRGTARTGAARRRAGSGSAPRRAGARWSRSTGAPPGRARLVKSRSTPSPPKLPGGSEMPCTTTSVIAAPGGRASRLGEGTWRACARSRGLDGEHAATVAACGRDKIAVLATRRYRMAKAWLITGCSTGSAARSRSALWHAANAVPSPRATRAAWPTSSRRIRRRRSRSHSTCATRRSARPLSRKRGAVRHDRRARQQRGPRILGGRRGRRRSAGARDVRHQLLRTRRDGARGPPVDAGAQAADASSTCRRSEA